MPRLKFIEPIQATGRAAELLAGPCKGRHSNMVKALAGSPAALEAMLLLEQSLDSASAVLNPAQRRLVLIVVSQALGSPYDLAAHIVKARPLGLTDDQITQARRGSISDPSLNALVRFTLALHEKIGRISDNDMAALTSAGFPEAAVAEIIALHALATFSCTFNLVNQTPVDSPPAPEI